jgi:hypothetical protein
MNCVRQRGFTPFAIYRIAVGIAARVDHAEVTDTPEGRPFSLSACLLIASSVDHALS